MDVCATLGQPLEPNTPHNLSATKVTSSIPPHLYPESARATVPGVELLLCVKVYHVIVERVGRYCEQALGRIYSELSLIRLS